MVTKPTILVYGADWCMDCLRAKRFLIRHNIIFQWIDIDLDPQAERFVRENNNGLRSIPTILFTDGSILVEPSNQELADKLRIDP
jgi:glutaredoxin